MDDLRVFAVGTQMLMKIHSEATWRVSNGKMYRSYSNGFMQAI
jgi:hypothetical protein